jgi:hypothetical protein
LSGVQLLRDLIGMPPQPRLRMSRLAKSQEKGLAPSSHWRMWSTHPSPRTQKLPACRGTTRVSRSTAWCLLGGTSTDVHWTRPPLVGKQHHEVEGESSPYLFPLIRGFRSRVVSTLPPFHRPSSSTSLSLSLSPCFLIESTIRLPPSCILEQVGVS